MDKPTPHGAASFGTIIGIFGAILIGIGVAWLIAINWHGMLAAVKIGILVVAIAASYTAATLLRERGYEKTAVGLLLLGALLYTLSIFLIAQIFNTDTSLQGTAWLLLIAWVGVLIAAYVYESKATLVLGLLEFLIWLLMQEGANGAYEHAFGMVALHLLAVGIVLYGLRALHSSHVFGRIYLIFTAVFALLCAYLLSFQFAIPYLWADSVPTTGSVMILAVLLVLGLGLVGATWRRVDRREGIGAVIVLLSLLLVIGISVAASDSAGSCRPKYCYDFSDKTSCLAETSGLDCVWTNGYCQEESCYAYTTPGACVDTADKVSCVWSENRCIETARPSNSLQAPYSCQSFSENRDVCNNEAKCTWTPEFITSFNDGVAPIAWIAWLVSNIVLLAVILLVVAYGTTTNDPTLINIGIVTFALAIITRYIGFMIDLWGYTSLAFVFITGGVLLLAGGFGIERLRRLLLRKAQGSVANSVQSLKKRSSLTTSKSRTNANRPKESVRSRVIRRAKR